MKQRAPERPTPARIRKTALTRSRELEALLLSLGEQWGALVAAARARDLPAIVAVPILFPCALVAAARARDLPAIVAVPILFPFVLFARAGSRVRLWMLRRAAARASAHLRSIR